MGPFSMRITVVGSGYLGLVAGASFAEIGHEVILVDNDAKKLAELKNKSSPIWTLRDCGKNSMIQ